MRRELTLVFFTGVIATAGCMSLSPDKDVAKRSQSDLSAQLTEALNDAMRHEAEGNLTAAREAYAQLLTIDPDHPLACHHLAILHDREGQFEESDKLYQRAIQSSENRAEVLTDYAYSQYVRGDVEQAEATLRIALADDPDSDRAHNNLGLVFASQGREKEAVAQFALGGCSQHESISNYENVRRWQVDPALAQMRVKDLDQPTQANATKPMMAKARGNQHRATESALVSAVDAEEAPSFGKIRRVQYQPTVTPLSDDKIDPAVKLSDEKVQRYERMLLANSAAEVTSR